MFGAADPFGNQTLFYCRACDYMRKAKRFYQLAGQAMERGDESRCTELTEKAQRAEADEQKMAGRWFECKLDGEGWDLSEKQIELAKQEGRVVEVMTEIV